VDISVVDFIEQNSISVAVKKEMQYPNDLRFDLNPQQIAELSEKIIVNTKKVFFMVASC
jgi:hypothetical protein